jgi:hypothetical protein
MSDSTTTDEVYRMIGPEARAAVDAARKYRGTLAGVHALAGLQPSLVAADAAKLDISVLRKDASGNMTVGMFDLPALNIKSDMLPKSECYTLTQQTYALLPDCWLPFVHMFQSLASTLAICFSFSALAAFDGFAGHKQKVLLFPQRLQCVFEAVQAVRDGLPLGVHLSGPNGVGKSAILLLVHLLCTAHRLPAAYIPRSETLVNEARKQDGGDAYILEVFWQQNADLIIENAALRRVFINALQGVGRPFTPEVMTQLRKAVGTPGLPGLAIIMDEVQHITDEVNVSKLPTAPTTVLEAGRYFAANWHDWTNANSRFQRISAASAHAERDTQLPDGENHRLRIIEPLDPDDRDALQKDQASPAFVHDAAARKYVVRIAGNVLRKLVQCAELLPRHGTPTKAELQNLWQTMWDRMHANCSGWLASLPEGERSSAATEVMALLSGNVQWGGAKILYDTGIVFRGAASPYVKPVSTAANAVLLRVASAHNLVTRVRTSSIADGRQRGFELERQVLARLDGFKSTHGVPCKLLDGTPTAAVDISCSYSLPFRDLKEVVEQDVPVLFCPTSGTFDCDAILMPAAGSGGVVYVIECSSTDPIVPKRIKKVGDYFRLGGVVEQLQARGYRVVVVLFHDSDLPARPSLSDGAISISVGKAPPSPPPAAATASAAASSSAPAAPSQPPAVSPPASAVKGKSKKAAPLQQAPVAGLGNVVRVVDAQSLVRPLGVLV